MSTGALTVTASHQKWIARLLGYLELTKPRIASLVLVVVAVSALVARWGWTDGWSVVHALLGTFLVAGSASALNQWLERECDSKMDRTSGRPLPSGRLSSSGVLGFGIALVTLGVVYLAATTNVMTAVWALVTWVLYVWIYTPLKTRTPLNTAVGAIAGALPVMIGWSATGGSLNPFVDPRGWALFLLVFLWQFPHFMAIAWLYREQYARAGMQMMPVVDPSGRRAGMQAVIGALALLPVSLVPALAAPYSGARMYVLVAFVAGVAQLITAAWFFRTRSNSAARRLLRASLVYLPAILLFLVLTPWM